MFRLECSVTEGVTKGWYFEEKLMVMRSGQDSIAIGKDKRVRKLNYSNKFSSSYKK